MDNRERVGRVELAAAFRMAARLGMHEGICNHFSLALTDDGREFLVNPHGYRFGELRARDLLRVEAGGRVLSGEGEVEVEPSALFIHGRMHLALPQVRCILHTHMPYATALTSIEGGRLEPINQNALRFVDQIAYDHDYGGLALDAAEGDRIAAALAASGSCSSPTTAWSPSAPRFPRPSTTSTISSAPARTRCWRWRPDGP